MQQLAHAHIPLTHATISDLTSMSCALATCAWVYDHVQGGAAKLCSTRLHGLRGVGRSDGLAELCTRFSRSKSWSLDRNRVRMLLFSTWSKFLFDPPPDTKYSSPTLIKQPYGSLGSSKFLKSSLLNSTVCFRAAASAPLCTSEPDLGGSDPTLIHCNPGSVEPSTHLQPSFQSAEPSIME